MACSIALAIILTTAKNLSGHYANAFRLEAHYFEQLVGAKRNRKPAARKQPPYNAAY